LSISDYAAENKERSLRFDSNNLMTNKNRSGVLQRNTRCAESGDFIPFQQGAHFAACGFAFTGGYPSNAKPQAARSVCLRRGGRLPGNQ